MLGMSTGASIGQGKDDAGLQVLLGDRHKKTLACGVSKGSVGVGGVTIGRDILGYLVAG